ncbi:predicted protein [Chaetoceros tenuissimus]|uniref:Uncharacterized protein n=1 Tax=Chaetoceros tenuissimus TaxID=426638 RepID=A0AAD3CLZ0_9STRA|nr:predicted protein [Chaetoceros tenuissimus]
MKAIHFPSRDAELLRLESISSPTSDPTVHELSSMLLSLKHCTLKTNKTSAIRRNKGSSTLTNVTIPSSANVPNQQKGLDSIDNISSFVASSRSKREKRYTKVSHLSRQELYRKLHDRYLNLNKELSCTRIKMQKAKALSSLSTNSSLQSMANRTGSGSAGADILQAIDNTLNPQSQHQIRQRERLHYFQQYKKKKQSTQDLKFLHKRKRIASLSSHLKLVYSSSLSSEIDQLSLSRSHRVLCSTHELCKPIIKTDLEKYSSLPTITAFSSWALWSK